MWLQPINHSHKSKTAPDGSHGDMARWIMTNGFYPDRLHAGVRFMLEGRMWPVHLWRKVSFRASMTLSQGQVSELCHALPGACL